MQWLCKWLRWLEMGGSSKQTIGYKYFAGLQVVVGSCIERILNINADNRGWIFNKPEEVEQLKDGDTSIVVNKPDLFGGDKQEGGWIGTIDIHTGRPEHLRQNGYLAEQDSELVSAFPFLSYLVFRGNSLDKGFQLVSMSGMLKEVLYWPKRTQIKDDGSEQWYKVRESDGAVVCEMGQEGANSCVYVTGTSNSYQARWSRIGQSGDFFLTDATGFRYSGSYTRGHVWVDLKFNASSATDVLFNLDQFLISSGENIVVTTSSNLAIESLVVEYKDLNVDWDVQINNAVFKLKKSKGIEERWIRIAWDFVQKTSSSYPTGKISDFYFDLTLPIVTNGYICTAANDVADINPIHKIREIITDDTAMNKPESMINDANFKAASDRIWAEGLGVSGSFTEKSCKDAIDELLYHIEAGIRVNRQTGKYEIVLFRDDLLDLDNAQLFNKSNIKTFNIEVANIDDVINSVNVNYYDRDNIKDSSFSLDEIGSVMSTEVNAETLDFPYFMARINAELVANWKLKQLSTPTRKGTFTTGKYEARKINRYDVVKLTWANQNMNELLVRVMKIGLGDGRDNTVTLDWVEVIPYSSTVFPTINVDPPTSVVLPPQSNLSIVFEMPYFEAVQRFGQTQVDAELANNPDLGYLVVATKKPQNNSINALLYTDDGTGYQQASIVDYCPVAVLDQEISYLDSTFAVKNVSSISQAEVGTLILCDQELMVYQSYDTATKILTVKRAALDTVPKPHLEDAVFYFYDAFNAFDSEQYVFSEVIDAKVLTTTPSGILDLSVAEALSLEMKARPIRPYPPANVKINDEYYPVDFDGDLTITWVNRNRIQQTGGSILGWKDAGVALESGVNYQLTLTELDLDGVEITTHSINIGTLNSYVFTATSMQEQTRTIEITLKTLRSGYECYQVFKHNVDLASYFSAPFDLAAEIL